MPERAKFASHDEYIASMPSDVQKILLEVQALVEKALPRAQRCISYSMPAFRDGRVFLYFAAFKKHIGIYPPVTRDAALILELAQFRGPKGNLSFPLGQPLPMALIERVVIALHKEYAIR